MGRISEQRVQTLERQTANLHRRLLDVEAQFAPTVVTSAPPAPKLPEPAAAPAPAAAPLSPVPLPAWTAPSSPPVHGGEPPPPAASANPAATAAQRERIYFEDLLGGRVLAWAGGVAVVAGIAFLLAIAVSRGWIGSSARTLLAGALSAGLIGAGTWLYDRHRTDAALATLSAGIAGLFTTVAVGGPVYGVLPPAVALMLALATGALATSFAVRWQSRGIGALGIVGALMAPVLAGAPSTATTLALLWVAAASGAAVLVWQRWNWLALAVFAIAAAQWLWWIGETGPGPLAIVTMLCCFGALNVAAAIGFELRVPASRLRASAALLLSLNAFALAVTGWFALADTGATTLGRVWIGSLAAAYIAVGLLTRSTRINRDVRLLSLVLGVVLADVTAGLVLQGAVLAGAFAVTTAGFGLLTRRTLSAGDPRARALLGLALGGHLLLTCVQALTQAPLAGVAAGDTLALGGYASIAVSACAAFVAGRFVDQVRPDWRVALDVAAMAGTAYLTTAALDGPVLAAAYAAEAVALGAIALRRRDGIAGWGGGAFLALALGYGVFLQAPPDALVEGLGDVPGTALALGAAALAALLGARQVDGARSDTPVKQERELLTRARATLAATGAVTLLYLASTALVTAFAPAADATATTGAFELGVREMGQLLLSALWAVSGLTALVIGLRRDDRALRLGSLALLLVTVFKVFLYDLAALTSLYRVGSFIGLGLLLLVAAGIWQRMRPIAPADLREVPPALR